MEASTLAAAIEARMIEAIIDLGCEDEDVGRDSTFESLDIDSLDLVELGQVLRKEFGLDLSPESFVEGIVTVGDALDVVLRYL
jgi:acyl carrier protein